MSFHRCVFVSSTFSFPWNPLHDHSLTGRSNAILWGKLVLTMANHEVLGVPFPWVLCSPFKDPILGCPGFYWVSEPHPWWSPIIWDFGCVFLILSVSMDDNDSITFIRREMYQSAKKNTALSHSHCFHLSLVPGVGFSIDSLINQSKYRTKDGLNPFWVRELLLHYCSD